MIGISASLRRLSVSIKDLKNNVSVDEYDRILEIFQDCVDSKIPTKYEYVGNIKFEIKDSNYKAIAESLLGLWLVEKGNKTPTKEGVERFLDERLFDKIQEVIDSSKIKFF